jgi:hypothetical protein
VRSGTLSKTNVTITTSVSVKSDEEIEMVNDTDTQVDSILSNEDGSRANYTAIGFGSVDALEWGSGWKTASLLFMVLGLMLSGYALV